MGKLSLAIAEAARATTVEEIALRALPAFAAALDACPAFLARSSSDFINSEPLAGEHATDFPLYLKGFSAVDPLIRAVLRDPRPVNALEHHVDTLAFRRSRAYREWHRPHDFEHHMLVRFFGDHLTRPGTLSIGFTRGRRLPEFGTEEVAIAELVVPALSGAVERILRARLRPHLEAWVDQVAEERRLTAAEARVLSVLLLGTSNQDIARHLCLSVETVKTHLKRTFRKLEVRSRAQAMALARDGRR